MAESVLLTVYREYLACLNDRRWDDLGRFVAEDVVHNGKGLGLKGYRQMLVADTEAIPDLHFDPEILVAGDTHLACRLFFRCTPARPFLGATAGSRISFAEHVFYRFDNTLITEVWSLIDKDAIAGR